MWKFNIARVLNNEEMEKNPKCLDTEYHTPKNGLSGYWEKTHPHKVDNYMYGGHCRLSRAFSISSFASPWLAPNFWWAYFDHRRSLCQHTFVYEKNVQKPFLIIPNTKNAYKRDTLYQYHNRDAKIPYTWMKKTADTLIPKTPGRAWWNVFQSLQTLPKTLLRPFINTLQAFYKRLWKI